MGDSTSTLSAGRMLRASRDKFMRSGQQVAVTGTVIGYYLFRRSEANRGMGA